MDKSIKCKDCGSDFVFSEGEQKYFEKLVQEGKITEFSEPKRCPKCRQSRKNNPTR